MPRRRDKFVIGGECFATKKAIVQRVRGILHNAPLGKIEGADRRFLTSFFSLHPNVKKALYIEEVFVTLHRMGHRTFQIETTSGDMLDISYKKPLMALTNLDSHRADVLLAMRQAVQPQIRGFKSREQGSLILGEELVVDHQWPDTFDALVRRFLEQEGAEVGDVTLGDGAHGIGKELREPWCQRWADFHREHAVLRLVSREDNSRWSNRNPELYTNGEAV